jgi:hypothetical protein
VLRGEGSPVRVHHALQVRRKVVKVGGPWDRFDKIGACK